MNYNSESTPVVNYIQLLKGFTFLGTAMHRLSPQKQREKLFLSERRVHL